MDIENYKAAINRGIISFFGTFLVLGANPTIEHITFCFLVAVAVAALKFIKDTCDFLINMFSFKGALL
jgi:hypothetical protein